MLTWLNLGLLLVSSPSSSVSISSTAIDCVAPENKGSERGPERGPESEKSEGGARSVRDFTSGFGVRSKLFVRPMSEVARWVFADPDHDP